MLQFLFSSVSQLIQPILVPLCFVFAWGIVGLVGWSLWSATRDSIKAAQRMHQIPCANCQFFTNTHYLKCPVHPSSAGTEEAVNCMDFEPKTYAAVSNSERAYH
jgi:hypothetical protein